MTPSKWIEMTGAIGINTKAGVIGHNYLRRKALGNFASYVKAIGLM